MTAVVILACSVLLGTAMWFALAVYRAPVACEGRGGFRIIEPGRRWDELSLFGPGRLTEKGLAFWGLG